MSTNEKVLKIRIRFSLARKGVNRTLFRRLDVGGEVNSTGVYQIVYDIERPLQKFFSVSSFFHF